jgi:hypothetical protein
MSKGGTKKGKTKKIPSFQEKKAAKQQVKIKKQISQAISA